MILANATEIVNMITNVGFPIVGCFCLGLYVKETQTLHKAEVDALTTKLNEQTLTIQKLVDRIDELLRGLTNENQQ